MTRKELFENVFEKSGSQIKTMWIKEWEKAIDTHSEIKQQISELSAEEIMELAEFCDMLAREKDLHENG